MYLLFDSAMVGSAMVSQVYVWHPRPVQQENTPDKLRNYALGAPAGTGAQVIPGGPCEWHPVGDNAI